MGRMIARGERFLGSGAASFSIEPGRVVAESFMDQAILSDRADMEVYEAGVRAAYPFYDLIAISVFGMALCDDASRACVTRREAQ